MPGRRASTKGQSQETTNKKEANKNSSGCEMEIGLLGVGIYVLRLISGFYIQRTET